MITTRSKIALACFLGSFLGALIAMQLHSLWWIGMIIGGVVGAFGFSPEQTVNVAKIFFSRDKLLGNESTVLFVLFAIIVWLPICISLIPVLILALIFVELLLPIFKTGYKTICTLFRIFYRVLIFAQTSVELLCLMTGILGSFAGFMFGNAFVGGVIGLIFGVAYYELVSIRLFKAVPQSS